MGQIQTFFDHPSERWQIWKQHNTTRSDSSIGKGTSSDLEDDDDPSFIILATKSMELTSSQIKRKLKLFGPFRSIRTY